MDLLELLVYFIEKNDILYILIILAFFVFPLSFLIFKLDKRLMEKVILSIPFGIYFVLDFFSDLRR